MKKPKVMAPIIISEKGDILDGHHRALTAAILHIPIKVDISSKTGVELNKIEK